MSPIDFDPGPLEQIEIQRDGGRSTLVFVRHLRHAPAKVWAALTERQQLGQWAPFQPSRNLAATGPAVLRIDGQTTEEHASNVLRSVAPELLEYTWGDDVLRWVLAPHGEGTRLTLYHTVQSPDWAPRTAAGWHLCLIVAERLLDGQPIGPIVGREALKYGWEKLHDAYAAKMDIAGGGWPTEIFPD